jgi:glyceraldehyde 3-phosphate dehydrogenase
MIPTSTGAARALTLVFPHLKDKIGGCGIRVPVPNVSLSDITFVVNRQIDIEDLNQKLLELSKTSLKGILGYTNEPLVSRDLLGMHESSTIDAQLTSVIGQMVKIVAWYDNESGYTSRLTDALTYIAREK